jgi:hypothetical protein
MEWHQPILRFVVGERDAKGDLTRKEFVAVILSRSGS